ncbi:MAG TPA: hypothetical protein VNT58_01030 [Gaiellaceae bacterium]|nr:hypothetical protein [Gaiellaceae bacterium]
MSLFDRIAALFGGGQTPPRDELGRHPDAQPVAAEQNERGPTEEEQAAAAAAEPETATIDSVAEEPPPDANLGAAERLDNPIHELEQPGIDLPPEGVEEPPA